LAVKFYKSETLTEKQDDNKIEEWAIIDSVQGITNPKSILDISFHKYEEEIINPSI